jgi:hypothetical protein
LTDKRNDINSTEKLLNAIRGKQDEEKDAIGKIPILSQRESLKFPWNNKLSLLFPKKKNYTVGVDISHDFIYLTKVISAPDTGHILLDQKIIKYDEKIETLKLYKCVGSNCVFAGPICLCHSPLYRSAPAYADFRRPGKHLGISGFFPNAASV